MQSHLFIGGNYNGLDVLAADDEETVQLPVGVTDKETYVRSTLTVGDVSVTFYIHESLTPTEALNRMVEGYKAWAVNQPGGRL
jgi:hypothetical protein